jgi:polyribonucleotide nucleotidyltransferase
MSNHAPRIIKMKINPTDPGSARAAADPGADPRDRHHDRHRDDGTISIACLSAEAGEAAQERIRAITAEVEVAKSKARCASPDFGATVQLLPGGRPAAHLADRPRARERGVRYLW